MERTVRNIAHFIANKQNLDKEKESVIAYGMLAISQMMIILLAALIWGLVTHTLLECLIIYITVGALRKYTGGAHANSMVGCIFVSITTMCLMATAAHYLLAPHFSAKIILVLSLIICYIIYFIVIWKKAPVDSPNKPIKKPDKIKRLRRQSFVFLFIYFIISILLVIFSSFSYSDLLIGVNYALLLALGWQCLTLTKVASLLFHNNRTIE